jgi:hypothetical protein
MDIECDIINRRLVYKEVSVPTPRSEDWGPIAMSPPVDQVFVTRSNRVTERKLSLASRLDSGFAERCRRTYRPPHSMHTPANQHRTHVVGRRCSSYLLRWFIPTCAMAISGPSLVSNEAERNIAARTRIPRRTLRWRFITVVNPPLSLVLLSNVRRCTGQRRSKSAVYLIIILK